MGHRSSESPVGPCTPLRWPAPAATGTAVARPVSCARVTAGVGPSSAARSMPPSTLPPFSWSPGPVLLVLFRARAAWWRGDSRRLCSGGVGRSGRAGRRMVFGSGAGGFGRIAGVVGCLRRAFLRRGRVSGGAAAWSSFVPSRVILAAPRCACRVFGRADGSAGRLSCGAVAPGMPGVRFPGTRALWRLGSSGRRCGG